MFSGTLALLDRSLRESVMWAWSHLFRLGFVALIFFCLSSIYGLQRLFGAPGLEFFQWVAVLNFLFISAAGIVLFTTAIGEEKEEAVLELLKLAGINRLSLLLGKSTGQLVSALVILSLQLPFTFLAITLGGVTTRQVLAMYVAFAAYLVGVANVGLFFSVVCRRVATAGVFTTVFLAVTNVLPSIVLTMLPVAPGGSTPAVYRVLETLDETSIRGRMDVILSTGFAESPFSLQVGSHLAAGVLFFLISWAILERIMGDHSPLTMPLQRNKRPSKRVWKNALVWKDFHFIAGSWMSLVAKSFLYAAIVIGIRYGLDPLLGNAGQHDQVSLIIGVMAATIVIELTFYSSRVFHEEIRNQTFASLRLLPLQIGEVARWKIAGCLLGLLPALSALFIGCSITPRGWPVLGPLLISPGVWCALLVVLCILHFAMLMSLTFRWWWLGAAMAVGMMAPATPILWMMVTSTGGWQVVSLIQCIPLVLLIYVMQKGIGPSLEKAAGR
ncbi:MAG: hypothetical protein HON53_17120 [Planctomycetaceae bacterium]|nr:hypothetical protein [Planctomycetaceae bacterium]MBT6155603.1 hypothetical protein [Planctomycetaceae bacterium]MBT6483775.1 hypothetical protein [Planctomycetaceae bacterium]